MGDQRGRRVSRKSKRQDIFGRFAPPAKLRASGNGSYHGPYHGSCRTVIVSALSLWALIHLGLPAAAADDCPKPGDEIATDRPDVTNSSIVVPAGSLQSENGINVSARDGARILDGPNLPPPLG